MHNSHKTASAAAGNNSRGGTHHARVPRLATAGASAGRRTDATVPYVRWLQRKRTNMTLDEYFEMLDTEDPEAAKTLRREILKSMSYAPNVRSPLDDYATTLKFREIARAESKPTAKQLYSGDKPTIRQSSSGPRESWLAHAGVDPTAPASARILQRARATYSLDSLPSQGRASALTHTLEETATVLPDVAQYRWNEKGELKVYRTDSDARAASPRMRQNPATSPYHGITPRTSTARALSPQTEGTVKASAYPLSSTRQQFKSVDDSALGGPMSPSRKEKLIEKDSPTYSSQISLDYDNPSSFKMTSGGGGSTMPATTGTSRNALHPALHQEGDYEDAFEDDYASASELSVKNRSPMENDEYDAYRSEFEEDLDSVSITDSHDPPPSPQKAPESGRLRDGSTEPKTKPVRRTRAPRLSSFFARSIGESAWNRAGFNFGSSGNGMMGGMGSTLESSSNPSAIVAAMSAAPPGPNWPSQVQAEQISLLHYAQLYNFSLEAVPEVLIEPMANENELYVRAMAAKLDLLLRGGAMSPGSLGSPARVRTQRGGQHPSDSDNPLGAFSDRTSNVPGSQDNSRSGCQDATLSWLMSSTPSTNALRDGWAAFQVNHYLQSQDTALLHRSAPPVSSSDVAMLVHMIGPEDPLWCLRLLEVGAADAPMNPRAVARRYLAVIAYLAMTDQPLVKSSKVDPIKAAHSFFFNSLGNGTQLTLLSSTYQSPSGIALSHIHIPLTLPALGPLPLAALYINWPSIVVSAGEPSSGRESPRSVSRVDRSRGHDASNLSSADLAQPGINASRMAPLVPSTPSTPSFSSLTATTILSTPCGFRLSVDTWRKVKLPKLLKTPPMNLLQSLSSPFGIGPSSPRSSQTGVQGIVFSFSDTQIQSNPLHFAGSHSLVREPAKPGQSGIGQPGGPESIPLSPGRQSSSGNGPMSPAGSGPAGSVDVSSGAAAGAATASIHPEEYLMRAAIIVSAPDFYAGPMLSSVNELYKKIGGLRARLSEIRKNVVTFLQGASSLLHRRYATPATAALLTYIFDVDTYAALQRIACSQCMSQTKTVKELVLMMQAVPPPVPLTGVDKRKGKLAGSKIDPQVSRTSATQAGKPDDEQQSESERGQESRQASQTDHLSESGQVSHDESHRHSLPELPKSSIRGNPSLRMTLDIDESDSEGEHASSSSRQGNDIRTETRRARDGSSSVSNNRLGADLTANSNDSSAPKSDSQSPQAADDITSTATKNPPGFHLFVRRTKDEYNPIYILRAARERRAMLAIRDEIAAHRDELMASIAADESLVLRAMARTRGDSSGSMTSQQ